MLTGEAAGVTSGDRGTAPAVAGIAVHEVQDRGAIALGLGLAVVGAVVLFASAFPPRRQRSSASRA